VTSTVRTEQSPGTRFPASWELPAAETTVFAPRRSAYCVCIPVINEGNRIRNQLRAMQDVGIPGMADIILIDGGSTDGSLEQGELTARGVRALLVKRGPGKLSAQLRLGYAWALLEGYDGILTVDGNGKDGIDAIPRFVDALAQGYDFVQGSRFIPGGKAIRTPAARYWGIRLVHAPLIRLASGFPFTDTTNGFRGYSRRFLLHDGVKPFRALFDTYELLPYLAVQAARLGFHVIEIPVCRQYPASGPTPTKIKGHANLSLLRILMAACTGQYNPRPEVSR
jgi:dolichol-phosphate mannosyltransferase